MDASAISRSVIWRPMRWLVTGEALLAAVAVPVAAGSYQVVGANELRNGAWIGELLAAAAFGLVIITLLHALGMHAVRSRHRPWQLGVKYLGVMVFAGAALWLLLWFRGEVNVSAGRIATVILVTFAVILAWRSLWQAVIDSDAVRRRVIVFGAGRKAGIFNGSMRRRSDRRGIEILGYLPLEGDEQRSIPQKLQLHGRADVERFCRRHRVDEIVIASDDHLRDLPLTQLVDCRFHGLLVTDAASFIEREANRIPVELVEPAWWLDRSGFSAGGFEHFLKRSMDMVASILLLVVAMPFMLACFLAIKLEDGAGASVLFRQKRVGLDGQVFDVFKFRSMREDAEKDGVARWASTDDDRVTRVGHFMRKTRLDELPQLINVFRGEMSLVGPRPERPEFVDRLAREIPYYTERHCVRPGITGWAQLCYPYGASTHDSREKLKYDLYYIKNNSLWFDLVILLRTVEVVLFGKGAR